MRIDEFDWDNLLIIDAARHDLYEEVNGSTRMRRTVGSSSEDFIKKTFSKGNWENTVVITANPHYHAPLFKQATGKNIDKVFKDVYAGFIRDDAWNEELGTVKPEKMVDLFREAVNEHGQDTNYIVHFMQPHTPFINSEVTQDSERDMNVWDRLEEGEFSDQEVWTAFKENLELVMDYVKEAKTVSFGKTVVTADHGNAFGENNEYGHPSGSSNPVLRQVPMDVLE